MAGLTSNHKIRGNIRRMYGDSYSADRGFQKGLTLINDSHIQRQAYQKNF